MSLNNEDEFGTRPATDQERLAWEAGNIHGIRATFTGVRVDARGNRINELTVIDDEFGTPRAAVGQAVQHPAGCTCAACQESNFKYMNWHQKLHRHQPDPACKICQAEQKFRSEHPDMIGKRVGVDG